MNGATLVGLMSGTSLDGVSAAVVRFESGDSGRISAQLLQFEVQPFSQSERESILQVINSGNTDAVCRLNFSIGEILARAAHRAIEASGIERSKIDAIASHGQTVWHVPGQSTLQIGEAAVIAERTGLPVISDFRVRDVAAGGQGAPLVPIADALLFPNKETWRALQNIGGIGNVTLVPPGGAIEKVLAFDTGPGVVIIDGVVNRLTGGRERMDRDGQFSAGGRAISRVNDEILEMPFFAMHPPKSTGRELFTAAFIHRFIERCREIESAATDADIISTAVELTARSIALGYRRFINEPVAEVLLSGGGARHPALRREIAMQLSPIEVRDFSEVYFDAEAKEAVAFALLDFFISLVLEAMCRLLRELPANACWGNSHQRD